MSLGLLLPLVFLLLLLCASGFFAGSETAFFSLKSWQLESPKASPGKLALVRDLLQDPPALLIALLLGNESVNVTFSFTASHLERGLAPGPWGRAAGVLFTAVVLVLFGEALPKAFSANSPAGFARAYAPVLSVVVRILKAPADLLVNVLERMPLLRPKSQLAPLEELGHLLRAAEAEGSFRKDEQEILVNLLKVQEEPASARMIPRTALRFVKAGGGWEEASKVAPSAPGGIIAVCREAPDDLLGIMTCSEVLEAALSEGRGDLTKRARLVPVYPETRPMRLVFDDLYRRGWPAVVLADEYGGIAGALTRASLAESLLQPGLGAAKGVAGRTFPGSTPYEQFRESFPRAPRDPRSKTLAGHVLNLAGRVPKEGESFADRHCLYKVARATKRQITEVEVEDLES